MDSSLKQAYINSNNLYDFVKAQFGSYQEWLSYEQDHVEELASWENERLFRIIESSKQGLIQQSVKGNAAAVSHLRSLLHLKAAPGRPKGKNGHDEKRLATMQAKDHAQYMEDAKRLLKEEKDN